MKKFNTLLKILFVSLTFVFVSCEIDSFAEEDQFSFGDITAPTNVQISASIAGTSSDNPNGDGSGEVSFSGSADNAIPVRKNKGTIHEGIDRYMKNYLCENTPNMPQSS